MKTFRGVEFRASWPETKKVQIKMVAAYKKNEQQHDAKNDAEL